MNPHILRRTPAQVCFLWLMSFSFCSLVVPIQAATFVVNSTGDGGDANTADGVCADGLGECTLRAAIQQANALAGTDTINFNIAGAGVHTINPNSALPTISGRLTVNGLSQPGFVDKPLVELNGANAGASANGLRIRAGNSSVSGLAINRFGGAGIRIETNGNNSILFTFIGTDASGSSALGNGTGVLIDNSANNSLAANLISGNTGHGLVLQGNASSGNGIQLNLIGTDFNGVLDVGNGASGVSITGGSENTIGSNTIGFNGGAGIVATGGSDNIFSSNAIFDNDGLGMDLGGNGVTPNDTDDGDGGPNSLQNFPVLTLADNSGGGITVEGSLNSTPNTEFVLEFFASPACDPSGFGEGMTLIGGDTVTTDGGGDADFAFTFDTPVSDGESITATATVFDLVGNTSEFSPCISVNGITNHPPVAANDITNTPFNTAFQVAAPGVLANDSDPDGDPLTAVLASPPSHAVTFGLHENGSFAYRPVIGFAGLDTFTYRANDGFANSGEAFVLVSVPAPTPTGSNVTVQLVVQLFGIDLTLSISFSNVTVAGMTGFTPIDPDLAGLLPGGYSLFEDLAFDLSTTAIFTGPITICFNLPGIDEETLDLLRVLHGEDDELVDVTIPPIGPGDLCAQVDSLSPFVIALVESNHPPVAVCKNVTVPAGTNCIAKVAAAAFNNGSSDPDRDPITFSVTPVGPYALGTTPVTLTVTDSHGASAHCQANVIVVDHTPPSIVCPANLVRTAPTGHCAVVVNYASPRVRDNCSATTACVPPSGSSFPVGVTTVHCVATDGSSNSATCNFKVTVKQAKLPTVSITVTDANASEPGANVGRFQVSRSGCTNTSLKVSYTVGGTATPGNDYIALTGAVTIPAGKTSALVTVKPKDDAVSEPVETVTATIAASPTYTVGAPSSVTVHITSNE